MLPEGQFRTIKDQAGYTTLQWQLKEEWRSLYVSLVLVMYGHMGGSDAAPACLQSHRRSTASWI